MYSGSSRLPNLLESCLPDTPLPIRQGNSGDKYLYIMKKLSDGTRTILPMTRTKICSGLIT